MNASAGPLHAADRERWAELWTAYLTFYETELPPATYTSTWSRILDPAGDIHGLGVRDGNGRLAGIAHFFYHPHAWSTHEACYLQDLFVDAGARGRGHARTLIAGVADAARARSASSLYWQTHQTNATARALYDRVARFDGFLIYDYALDERSGR